MRLDNYTTGDYRPGAPFWQQLLWYFIGQPILSSYWLPMSFVKVWVLRLFGAQIGQKVRIKPGLRVKFPWRLRVGDYVWIGEDTWIDNLAMVEIESHVCVSQGVYFCTGNHDWTDPNFRLQTTSIYVAAGSWIGAKAIVGPGARVGKGAILCMGSVAPKYLEEMMIYAGNPAQIIKSRIISQSHNLEMEKG
jgi:putative colanic acid biosynthesis acetyltransferase WcaF